MKKEQLEKFDSCYRDLLEWIKYFLSDKVEHQKVQDGYIDDKKKAEARNLKYFDRKLWQLKIINASTHDELGENTRQITTNGIKAHGTFSISLLSFYKHIVTVKRLKSIRDINTNLINTYIELKLKDKKEWTQKNYYTQIRSLFKFIDKYSISDDNFIFDIGITAVGKRAKSPVKSIPSKSIKYLEPNEFVDFIASFKTYKNNHPSNVQPTLLMKVLAFTGLRASELRGIKIDDVSTKIIDGDKYLQIYISGKNDIDGYVFILYKLIAKEYETELSYRQEHKLKTPYLFYTRDFTPYAEKSLYDLVKRYLKNAKITKPMDSHGLRRSYASYLLSKGVPRERISTLLRHTDRDSLDFYAFASDKSYKNVKNILEII
jgi:site-specific recombinase XerD